MYVIVTYLELNISVRVRWFWFFDPFARPLDAFLELFDLLAVTETNRKHCNNDSYLL